MKWMWIVMLLWVSAARAQTPDPSAHVGLDGHILLWDVCGGEGDRPCQPGDPAWGQLSSLAPLKCDRTLDLQVTTAGIVCVDKGRRSSPLTKPLLSTTLARQQEDQFSLIGADLEMNYTTILGTHNSYSNNQDGGGNPLNLDQGLTITDQLWLGARHIRLDPVMKVDDSSATMCHVSPYDVANNPFVSILQKVIPNFPATDTELCNTTFKWPAPGMLQGPMSFERPFYLALRELRVWLDRNPAEVVVLNINNFYSSTDPAYLAPADIAATIRHELGAKLLTFTDFGGYVAQNKWPTRRQMRTLGKQVIVFMATSEGGSDPVGWPTFDGSPGNSTSRSQFWSCTDPAWGTSIGLGQSRDWEGIGEDRSLSNAFNPPADAGLLGPLEVEQAVYCGFSLIGLDFFYTLGQAPKGTVAGFGLDYTGGVDPACIGCEPRSQAMIWSWNNTEFLNQSMPATLQHISNPTLTLLPEFIRTHSYRWTQADENTALPFACAGPVPGYQFPDYTALLRHTWTVTSTAGPWSQGEDACQALGSEYHFWRPMTSPDNQQLMNAMDAAAAPRVWLNHYPGTTRALPGQVTLNYNQGAPLPTTKSILVSSGFGGKLTAQFIPGSGSPAFATVSQANPGSPVFLVTVDHAAVASTPLGTYTGVVRISEENPATNAITTSDVKVTLNLSSAGLVATPSTVDFRNSSETISITSSSSGQLGYVLSFPPQSFMTVHSRGAVTPGTLELDLTSPAPGHTTVTASVMPLDLTVSPATIRISFEAVTTTAASSPTGIPIRIDGQQGSPVLVLGSTHQLTAPPSYLLNGVQYTFDRWNDDNRQAGRTFTASNSSRWTAYYRADYRLTLTAVPSNGGTFRVNSAAPQATYAAGTALSIAAVPAAGYTFKQYSGDSTSQNASIQVVMNSAVTLQGQFVPAAQPKTTFTTNPAGLSLVIDGATYPTPVSLPWAVGENHTVQAPVQLSSASSGTRFVFASWSDGNTQSTRGFGGSAGNVTYTAGFATQNLLTVNVTPSAAGTVGGTGWYGVNGVASLAAVPAAGFAFAGYSGGVTSTASQTSVTVNAPLTVTANFRAASAPVLYASSAARTDLGNGVVAVPIVITNLGPGPAGNAVISAIDGFQVPQGAGGVSAVFPANGIPLGTLAAGARAQTVVNFQWPTSAARATFTVHYTANGGAYRGANTISIYR